MSDNAKSLSTQANPITDPLMPPVNVTFQFDPSTGAPKWSYDPAVPTIVKGQAQVEYSLSPQSAAAGWFFTGVTLQDHHTPPAWSFDFNAPNKSISYPPNSLGVPTLTVPDKLKISLAVLEPKMIKLETEDLNPSGTSEPMKIAVYLIVSNAKGESYKSPDPQIVLEPRPSLEGPGPQAQGAKATPRSRQSRASVASR